MERDAKGRFIKGNDEGRKISGGVAAEMQERSVASRKEHRTVAEVLRAQLMEKAGDGNLTKLEYLTLKAITTHAKGDMTMKDLREMQKVLGEDTDNKQETTINITIGNEAAAAGDKWSSKQ